MNGEQYDELSADYSEPLCRDEIGSFSGQLPAIVNPYEIRLSSEVEGLLKTVEELKL